VDMDELAPCQMRHQFAQQFGAIAVRAGAQAGDRALQPVHLAVFAEIQGAAAGDGMHTDQRLTLGLLMRSQRTRGFTGQHRVARSFRAHGDVQPVQVFDAGFHSGRQGFIGGGAVGRRQAAFRAGQLRKITIRRVVEMVGSAVDAGADAVLVTCSSIGPAVTLAQQLFDVPVLRIDEAMAEEAVRKANIVGVLATLRTTLEPTLALLRTKAADAGREVKLIECLCEDAFPAVMAGDTETHDRLLREALLEDLKDVDAIVLAQASMARVVASLPEGALKAPVLSSPELAVRRARQLLMQ